MIKKRIKKTELLLSIDLCLIAVIACNWAQGKDAAEKGVEQFHNQLNAGQFKEIYAQADESFKSAAKEEDAIALFDAVKRKLGDVKKASPMGFFANTNTSGTFVTLTYETEFSEGKATEKFIFKINGEKALLYNYNIDSSLLITK